jgi:hypothetical protein
VTVSVTKEDALPLVEEVPPKVVVRDAGELENVPEIARRQREL